MPNPRVFLDVSINKEEPKRITIELYADTTPITAAKFHSLVTGQNISKLHYKNSTFHRILRRPSDQQDGNFMSLCQAGKLADATKQDLECVYGIGTKPENFIKKHNGFGTVSMVSPRGPQFFILTGVSERNDGKYVVVGRVVDGLDFVNDIASVGSFTGEPLASVVIVDCGVVRENLAPSISECQKMSSKEFERVISTSNKKLLNSLKKITSVNKQLIEVDPEDVILENEEELVEIIGTMENNLNVLFHLKAEVCSLEKRQNQLVSQTRAKNLRALPTKIPKAALPAKLVETSHQNTEEISRHPFVTSGLESQDFSDKGPRTKKIPKKKTKYDILANPDETTPQYPACQAGKECSHCGVTQTPQWRTGPMGPKTLCNACGIRHKSGRLLPHYRPAASPAFDPTFHSNRYRKIPEMLNSGMFKDVTTTITSIDAEPENILTESNALWSI